MEIELMVKEDFHINQKEWQEIEEYENEYRKNVKKQEDTEAEIKQLLLLSKSSMEILYQQWGECQEIYKLQDAVQEFEKQAMRECQREEEALEEQYRNLKAMEEEIGNFFEINH